MSQVESRRVKVGGLDTHYITGGRGDPLVIIHGGGEGARAWIQNLEELSKYYTVYLPDLPGFGSTHTMSEGGRIPDFAAFVNDFSYNLELKRISLVGHSVGGGIALHYALMFPHKIKKLVLVGSMGLDKAIAPWVRFLCASIFRRSLGKVMLAMLSATEWLVRFSGAPFEFVNPLSWAKIDMGKNITLREGQLVSFKNRLPELNMPTLLIWGANDAIVPVNQAYVAAELIPDCQLHVIEGCGHTVHRQKVCEFTQLLIRFLG